MKITVTKWEAQRIADILRCREVPQSQFAWADDLARKIEFDINKFVEMRDSIQWKKR
jgi:hypothetical protein